MGKQAGTMASGARAHFSKIKAPNADFCETCGAMLVIPDFGKNLECNVCKTHTPMTELKEKSLFSSVKPRAFAPDLCFGEQRHNKQDQLATVNEECPKCGYGEMAFYCLQLRSVDEGQTVFYSCLNCGHTYSTNT